MKFAIRSKRVMLPFSSPQARTILVSAEKIEGIFGYQELPSDCPVMDVGNSVVMPGIVDTHAHINEPGRTEWEGFRTATRAAAAGGITTVIDMPLNSIPATTSVKALQAKAESARGQCSVDYGFWGGVVPGNCGELQPMVDQGVMGFKAFLIDSGVDEFPSVTEADLKKAMPILAKAGVPLLVHAELQTLGSSGFVGFVGSLGSVSYAHYLSSRPQKWEVDAIQLMIRLAGETGCRVHIVHLSAADALEDLTRARASGIPITVETCPHYLALASEEIRDGATQFKCAPPIREKQNQDRLWKALETSQIDFIVSDHSPCTPRLKNLDVGDFDRAWGGVSGLQFSLPVIWTEMKNRNLEFSHLVRWMCEGPAQFLGLGNRKGKIAPGYDADLVILNPEKSFTLSPSMIQHRHLLTPYEAHVLDGVVEKTFLRGHCVYESGRFYQAMGQNIQPSGDLNE